VGSRFTGMRFILMRVLGAVLRDDRGDSPYQLVSRVVWLGSIEFRVLFSAFGFYFERLLSISIGSASADVDVVLI
jgi:hypothetical protein